MFAAADLLAVDVVPIATPEPSTIVMFGGGVIALIVMKKRFKK